MAALFENDSIHAFHGKESKRSRKMETTGPVVGKKDEFIMDTNSSSIVSKRSVEKLYYPSQPSYFRHFVRKFQRRSPLINRGYWLRMKAIERTVERFLAEPGQGTKLVVNLGCGYDPLPFQFLGLRPDDCSNAVFIDVDYLELMRKKVKVIEQTPDLQNVLPEYKSVDGSGFLLAQARGYRAVGCNLNDVKQLDQALRNLFDIDSCSMAILFVAEVSVAYMEKDAANAVLKWAASLRDARFCLLEQHLPDGPDHPFAQTMLRHFTKLRTPLHAIGTLDEMCSRFQQCKWNAQNLSVRTLWELWSDDAFITPHERLALDKVEPFDEWEEFALFGAHYFILVARTTSLADGVGDVALTGQHVVPAADSSDVWTSTNMPQHEPRRFGAACVHDSMTSPVSYYGGLGTKQRLAMAELFCPSEVTDDTISDLPVPLMCHSITSVRHKSHDCPLLAGGRASPDRASHLCWILEQGKWIQTHALPTGRYRHSAVQVSLPSLSSAEAVSTVLIAGGKASDGTVLDDWLLFDEDRGWIPLQMEAQDSFEPRFGAAMAVTTTHAPAGQIMGGMRKNGTIIEDAWNWTLVQTAGSWRIKLEKKDAARVQSRGYRPFRLGAQLVSTESGTILIGGIAPGRLLSRHEEIVNITTRQPISVNWADRPFMVGISAVPSGHDIVVLGGGATCFSFGTCWSKSVVVHPSTAQDAGIWQVSRPSSAVTKTLPFRSIEPEPPGKIKGGSKSDRTKTVAVQNLQTVQDFQSVMLQGRPAVLRGLDLGTCIRSWTTEYLAAKIGPDRQVVVHSSTSPSMNFQTKNFTYETMAFGSFIAAAEQGAHMYLRALSSEKPAESPTNLASDFPSIAQDFQLPDTLSHVTSRAHSSPLRIAGTVNMWLHYDVMANVLCQIRGRKTVRLVEPRHAMDLGVPAGGSSSELDLFSPEARATLRRIRCEVLEVTLEEGDVLYIPPLWLHAARPLDGLSVAVNVFFRDDAVGAGYAAGKDVYGNRDLAAYERGRRDVGRIVKSFEGLPGQVREAYLRRLAGEILASV